MRKLLLLLMLLAVGSSGYKASAQTWTGNAPAEGTFFLYNVGAEKFINNGDPQESWGTNAYLQEGFGLDLKLELSNGAYKLNTNVSNGNNSNYLGIETWCDAASTEWTFTAVEGQTNTYTISNGESFLVANDALNDVVCKASTNDNKSWWKLVSLDDFKSEMKTKAYAATDPMDVSVFIQGRSFARNDGRNSKWTTSHEGGNWVWIGASDNKYYGNESWNNTFDVHQELTGLPDGTYEVKCSGFGTNGTTYIYANTASNAIQTDNSTTYGNSKEAKWKAIHEDNAFAGQTTGTFTVEDGKITLGIKRETNTNQDWCVYDEFRLYYYGLEITDEKSTALLNAVPTGKMKADVQTTLNNAKTAFESEINTVNYHNLDAAISDAQSSANAYAHLTPVIDDADAFLASATLPDEAKTTFNEVYTPVKTAYTEGTISDADIMSKVIDVYNALAVLAKAQTVSSNNDMTYAIINHSFEYGDMTGWTNTPSTDTGVKPTDNATYAAANSHRFFLFNTYWQGTPITQSISGLPNGQYTLSAKVSSDGATIYLTAQGEHNEGTETGGTYPTKDTFQDASITFLVKDGNAVIGAIGGAEGTAGEHKDYVDGGYWWYKVDNFRLVYNRALTIEEMATPPTAISVSDVTVYKGKTASLTLEYTPNDATEGFVSYESSEPAVATVASDGTITGVGYGSTTITVTSTLDNTVSATCNVTVTAPHYNELVNLDFADGPVVTQLINTYQGDISNNGGVAQMQTVSGWDFGVSNGDGKASGVVTYGSENGVGNSANSAKDITKPDETSNEKCLAMVGVWTGSVQYVQNVKLESGKYTLTIPVIRNGGTENLTKNMIGVVLDDGTEYYASTKKYDTTWKVEKIEFTLTEEKYGKISLGLTNPNEGSGKSQRLYIDRVDISYEPFATVAEKTALSDALSSQLAIVRGKIGFDAGEYAPYNHAEALAAISQAQALDLTESSQILQSVVTGLTTILNAATWTANAEELNAFYDGDFSECAEDNTTPLDYTPKGWTPSINFRMMLKNAETYPGLSEATASSAPMSWSGGITYGEQLGYEMPLAAHTIYELKLKAAGWNNETRSGIQVSILNGTDGMATYNLGTPDRDIKGNASNTAGMTELSIIFATGEAGNYVFKVSSGNNFVLTDLSLLKAASQTLTFADNSAVPSYAPGTYPTVKIERTLSADRWATAVYPFAVSGVDNIAVLESYDAETGAIGFTTASSCVANVPFLMRSTSGVDEITLTNVEVAKISSNPAATANEASLKGTYSSIDITNEAINYVLSNNKIYKVGDAGATINPYRAYIQLADGASVKALSFNVDGLTTDIQGVTNNAVNDGKVYDLSGRVVKTPSKGMYIVNGKKVLVK